MSPFTRKNFLRQCALALAGLLVHPRLALSAKDRPQAAEDEPLVFDQHAIIDLHCHPSLKIYLLGMQMANRHHQFPGSNLFHMQDDLYQLKGGYVHGFLATHYLLEAATEKQWNLLKFLFPFIQRHLHAFADKIEHEDARNFDQINKMMDLLEAQLNHCNSIQTQLRFEVVDSYQKFMAALAKPGTIPVAHSIEGSHALGRNFLLSDKRKKKRKLDEDRPERLHLMKAGPGEDPAKPYLDNLDKLHCRGVCLMSLAHFFRNDLVYPVDGISPDGKRLPGMAWQYTPDQDRPLSYIGQRVVNRMLEIGMVVDLTHTSPQARADVFAINRQRTVLRAAQGKPPRPVVFTHTGAQTIFDYYDQGHYPYYKYYAASDEEIAAIAECDGVIGILAENFWLVGADTHLRKEFRPAQFRDGIPYMLQTIKYINSRTPNKDFRHVAIGTDFDGLADAPRDLCRPRQLKDLIEALKSDPEIGPDAAARITSTNALRVLELGWGDCPNREQNHHQ